MKLAGPFVVSSASFIKVHALRLQAPLELAHVGELRHRLRVLVPARIEGEDVLLEHPLEQPDDVARRS